MSDRTVAMNNTDESSPLSGDEALFGRDEQVKEIVRNLSSAYPRSRYVIGGRKSGKTSFLRAIETRLRVPTANNSYGVLPVYINLTEHNPRTHQEFFRALLQSLGKTVNDFLSETRHQIDSDDEFVGYFLNNLKHRDLLTAFENAYNDLLRNYLYDSQIHRIAFLIDNFDYIATWDEQPSLDLFNYLKALLDDRSTNRTFSVVIAGSNGLYSTAQIIGSPLAFALRIVELEPLPIDSAGVLLEHLSNISSCGNRLAKDFNSEIFELVGGHPYLLKQMVYCLCNEDASPFAPTSVDDCVRQLHTNFDMWIQKFEPLELKAYRILANYPDGLTAQELTGLVQGISKTSQLELEMGLRTLVTTGIVRKRKNQTGICYCISGTAFKDRFMQVAA